MADTAKLKELIANDIRFKGKTPAEILAIGSVEDQPIPTPPVKTHLTTWEAQGIGDVSLADIEDIVTPRPQYKSPEGAPGSYHVQKEGEQFRLFWDFKPQAEAPLFESEQAAEAWQKQWYADNPPVEVKLEAVAEVAEEAIEVKK